MWTWGPPRRAARAALVLIELALETDALIALQRPPPGHQLQEQVPLLLFFQMNVCNLLSQMIPV